MAMSRARAAERLPESFLGLIAAVGEAGALRLCQAFGGCKLPVPLVERLPRDHRFVRALGPEAARALCVYAGGGLLYIPRLAAFSRAKRNQQIADERAGGASIAELCHRHGLCSRQIGHILSQTQGVPMRYIVGHGSVHHDNVVYPSGSIIELPPDQAAPLLECGAIQREVRPFAASEEAVEYHLSDKATP